jgi:hypothetical protein
MQVRVMAIARCDDWYDVGFFWCDPNSTDTFTLDVINEGYRACYRAIHRLYPNQGKTAQVCGSGLILCMPAREVAVEHRSIACLSWQSSGVLFVDV